MKKSVVVFKDMIYVFSFISEPSHMIRTQMKQNLIPWLSIRNNRSTDGRNEYLWEEKVRLNWTCKIKLNLKYWGCWFLQNYLSKPHVSFHLPYFSKTNSLIGQMLLFQYVRFWYVDEICFLFFLYSSNIFNYFALQLLFRVADLCAELSTE